ncbi:hypothetical protein BD289DRAFT_289215 [Coniella lustricola]|uniref:Uncharacterized protein n=1 Tax=Coniella lustricola TaxID=2025994 RepID=A0A2T3A5I8_9PEZI|nr:hypothetical protein BD289DRAFT_289215 [Coniella lustricola]
MPRCQIQQWCVSSQALLGADQVTGATSSRGMHLIACFRLSWTPDSPCEYPVCCNKVVVVVWPVRSRSPTKRSPVPGKKVCFSINPHCTYSFANPPQPSLPPYHEQWVPSTEAQWLVQAISGVNRTTRLGNCLCKSRANPAPAHMIASFVASRGQDRANRLHVHGIHARLGSRNTARFSCKIPYKVAHVRDCLLRLSDMITLPISEEYQVTRSMPWQGRYSAQRLIPILWWVRPTRHAWCPVDHSPPSLVILPEHVHCRTMPPSVSFLREHTPPVFNCPASLATMLDRHPADSSNEPVREPIQRSSGAEKTHLEEACPAQQEAAKSAKGRGVVISISTTWRTQRSLLVYFPLFSLRWSPRAPFSSHMCRPTTFLSSHFFFFFPPPPWLPYITQ